MQLLNSKTTNVLFLIYDLERGGPELRLLDFARHFPSHFKIHICVTSRKLSLLPEFLQSNVKILVLPVKKGYLEIHKAWVIYNYLKINHIFIVNSFGLKELFLASAIKIFGLLKIRTIHHSVEFLHHYSACQKALLTILLKLTNSVICNSDILKTAMKSFRVPDKKIEVIRNGVDTSTFRKTSLEIQAWKYECGIQNNETIFGTIANFRKEKNYPFLLRGFKILVNENPNLKLICVGGGGLLDDIKCLAQSYAIENSIIFTGYTKNVIKYLALMDIFVLCSLREGFPNVVLQAMSMGIPVLVSNVGGCSEMIKHMYNGLLFQANQLNEFIQFVELLLQNKKLGQKLGINARKTVEEEFSIGHMIKQYSNFYDDFGY